MTWLAATSGARALTSSSPAAVARSRVWALRPSEAQSTRRPFARAEAPTMPPMSPGCRRPSVERAIVRLSLGKSGYLSVRWSILMVSSPARDCTRSRAEMQTIWMTDPGILLSTNRARPRPRSEELFPQAPDLLGRPSACPLVGHIFMSRGVAFGRLDLHEVQDLEAIGAKEPDPLADGQGEFHRLVVGPLQSMQPEVVADKTVRGWILTIGSAQIEEGAILEKDQMAPGPEEPDRLRDPAVGITPYAGAVLGEREIEARVRQRNLLGIAMQEREAEAVLPLEGRGRLELPGGVVDAEVPGAPSREPGRPVGGAAAKLYDVLAVDLRHDAKITLRHPPYAPGGLVARPGTAAVRRILHAEPVPVSPVSSDVLWQIVPAHGWATLPSTVMGSTSCAPSVSGEETSMDTG